MYLDQSPETLGCVGGIAISTGLLLVGAAISTRTDKAQLPRIRGKWLLGGLVIMWLPPLAVMLAYNMTLEMLQEIVIHPDSQYQAFMAIMTFLGAPATIISVIALIISRYTRRTRCLTPPTYPLACHAY